MNLFLKDGYCERVLGRLRYGGGEKLLFWGQYGSVSWCWSTLFVLIFESSRASGSILSCGYADSVPCNISILLAWSADSCAG